MPIVNGAYVAPTWNNDAPPAINAAELQDICDTIETYNTSKADVSYVNTFVRPNLLDNAYFVGGGSQQGGGQFPINQRGATSYSGAVYGLDRWKVSNANGSVSVGSQKTTFSCASGTSDLMQIIDGINGLLGKTLTLSILLNEGLYLITGTVPSTVPSSETTVAYSYILGSNQAGIWIRVSSDGITAQCRAAQGTPLNIIAVKLEIGDTQTLAHQENGVWVLNEVPNFEVELAKCQRYFQTLKSSFSPMFYGGALSGTTVNIFIPLPVTMRSSPTLSPSPIPLDVFNGSTYTSDVKVTINSATSRENGIRINGTSDKSLTSGAISAQIREQATTTLTLSADL